MIDKDTGEIAIDSVPIVLGPSFVLDDLLSSSLAGQCQAGPGAEPYRSLVIGEHLISGLTFFVTLGFYGQKLEFIDLLYSGELPDGSKTQEAERKKVHDRWLVKQLGKASSTYKWGEISSDYDPRSDTSSIVIRYSWGGAPWPRQRRRE
jgi:hypothetical protein